MEIRHCFCRAKGKRMAAELVLFALAGCFLGIFTGIAPGIHVNTIALLALSFPFLGSENLVVLIASMSIVHCFVDFVPSILLGAPDSESFLSALPGHRLLMQGKGLVAVKLAIAGGLLAGIASIAIGPLFILFVLKSAGTISAIVPFALIAILFAMVLEEKGKKKAWAITVIALSGMLGLLALKSNISVQEPLFCLASGFFGASTLVDSIMKKSALPRQKKTGFSIKKARIAKNSALAIAAAAIVSLLPSIGSNQAAFIVRKATGKIRASDYLIMLGGINTTAMVFSFFVLFAWGKTRTGSAAAISQLGNFGMQQLLLTVAASAFALGFGAIAADLIASKALKAMQSLNYGKIGLVVLAFMAALVFLFSNAIGIAFFATAAATGIASINAGIKRTNSMAFLMMPTIAYYFLLA